MNGNELIKRLKKHGYNPKFETGPGKGSHGRLYVNGKSTTMKDRKKEIAPGLLNGMLKQLGLTKKDIT